MISMFGILEKNTTCIVILIMFSDKYFMHINSKNNNTINRFCKVGWLSMTTLDLDCHQKNDGMGDRVRNLFAIDHLGPHRELML